MLPLTFRRYYYAYGARSIRVAGIHSRDIDIHICGYYIHDLETKSEVTTTNWFVVWIYS
jgi:hypothetical protein